MAVSSRVILGDCRQELALLRRESARLAYCDPPFFSQKVHRLAPRGAERACSFPDRWRDSGHYARFLFELLVAVRDLLTPDGAVFMHCDRRANHIVRGCLDAVFGPENLRAEIIWQYRRWSNARRALLPSHQTIYYYTKSERYVFHSMYTEYSPATNVEQILQRRCRDASGKSAYQRDESGRITPGPAKKGVLLGDVWDIPYLNPKAKERVGYPTQKPVALLERIIHLASEKGDTVVDPCCGSGTTLVAAALSGRHAIGIDESAQAVAIARQRLRSPLRSESRLMRQGRASYFQADIDVVRELSSLPCVLVQRNARIDALWHEAGDRPIPVRVQRPEESLGECAERVRRSTPGEAAQAAIVVATRPGPPAAVPPGVVVLQGLAAQLAAYSAVSREPGTGRPIDAPRREVPPSTSKSSQQATGASSEAAE